MKNGTMTGIPVYLDPDNGMLKWMYDVGTGKAGCIAGTELPRGYRQIKYKGKRYLAHRIVFFFTYGYLPLIVDHIDGNTKNNNPGNLREANASQNMINRKHQKNNKSGHTGIDWMPRQRQWRSQIHKEGKKIYLGIFKGINDAIKARKSAEEKYHGEYTRK
tara:strand:- start:352 stop:834 length:483 start_codon:yes stop_codon:yes gene_type:complete